ncbi:MAG: rhomboid family intramembrane serine protease [Planctomycetes bacterium]|nr:rhomboid family intramembrane serine protease [Planctomycetota bacterium]
MGIHDRSYYRDDDDRSDGIHVSSDWSVVTKLVVINAAVILLSLFIPDLMHKLAASPHSLTDPRYCWQLLTYGFAHDPDDVWHVFWNMFGLWMFGRSVEGIYGSKEFLRVYLVVIVLGGIIWAGRVALTSDQSTWGLQTVLGASGAVTAVTLLFCIHFPKNTIHLMMVLPVPAWFVGAIIIVSNLLGLADANSTTAFDVHLVGAAFAVCYYRFKWNLGRLVPSSLSGGVAGLKRALKPKPKLRVHAPDEDYGASDAEGDALLDKVNREGIDSLTSREKKALEAYSRRMQQKHR